MYRDSNVNRRTTENSNENLNNNNESDEESDEKHHPLLEFIDPKRQLTLLKDE